MERTLPYSWYTDPEILRREEELILRPAWQYAGHTGQLGSGAGYFATRAGHTPVVVTRDADSETGNILEEEYSKGAFSGLIHCFSSGPEIARRALALGMYISISGIVTFKAVARNAAGQALCEMISPIIVRRREDAATKQAG